MTTKETTTAEVIDKIFDKWSKTDELRLRGGEMTAQEIRTVKAVLNAVRAELVIELKAR